MILPIVANVILSMLFKLTKLWRNQSRHSLITWSIYSVSPLTAATIEIKNLHYAICFQ